MRDRSKQRANRRMQQEFIGMRNNVGILDPTPYHAVKNMVNEEKRKSKSSNKDDVARRSDFILRRRLLISYHGGKQIVYVTLLQTLRMKIGDRVYLIKTNMPIRPYKACKMD